MKTIVAALIALFATIGPAWAHGGDTGGGPVMGGAPPMSGLPVHVGFPMQSGFPMQRGFPIVSRPEPDRTTSIDRKRRARAIAAFDYGDLCKPGIYVPAIYQQYQVKGGAPCSVETQNGMVALPPPFAF